VLAGDSDFNPFHATDDISRLEALAYPKSIYLVFEMINKKFSRHLSPVQAFVALQ
jgi:hypothetical protein